MESYDKQTVFYVLLGISLLLTRTPVIGKYFRVVNTMIHESGHALMTLFTSGSILKVELFSSTEGDTVTKSSSRFCQMLIALAGYPFSSAAA
ncbi:MAG TPA: M50 family metallopeptidase, partial [Bacteroidales bacterium]|nr:M50 family metallopeptidase [Bacteroidales bacterium]